MGLQPVRRHRQGVLAASEEDRAGASTLTAVTTEPNALPSDLPGVGDTVRYRWRDDAFALRCDEPNVWRLRDGDSSTLGHLNRLSNGTYRFLGNPYHEVPNLDAGDWRPILLFASVPGLP